MAREALASKARIRSSVSWTTDAPFRETRKRSSRLDQGRARSRDGGAALYTFARAAEVAVLCLALVTNTMGQTGEDFEKGDLDGTADALTVLEAIASRVHTAQLPQ